MSAAPVAATLAPTSRPAGGSALTGTAGLVRFILRRDRVRLSVWTISMVLFYSYFTVALDTVFADEAARQGRAAVMETPAGIVMGGPGYGLDNYTTGVAMANEGITWVVLALAILSILHVVRHTRAEEESGCSELVRAAVVGRHAPPVAAVITLVVVNAVIALLSALAMTGVSEGELDLTNALAMTIGSGLSALVFGAVAVVMCQITEHGRAAIGASLAVFAVAFVVRAVGDMQEQGGNALSWFSPIAWAQQMRAFVDLRWWPAALSVVTTAVLLGLGAVLASRRDFGGGMVASRGGRADARASLRSPFALAWVQQRPALLWSCLGLGLMWYASGTLMPEIATMIGNVVESNPVAQQIFGADPSALTLNFLSIMILYAALCSGAYATVMATRPKAEESSGRVELALALPLSRTHWLGAQLLVAGLGTVVLFAVSVYAMWAGAVSVDWEDQSFGDYTEVVWTHVPALTVYLGLTAALFAWVPRATGLGWALIAYTFLIGMFGELFDLPGWTNRISPFSWVPTPFVETAEAGDMIGTSAIAVALIAVAFIGFRRRDVVPS
jgi:ABC-2 type transport system permease protein